MFGNCVWTEPVGCRRCSCCLGQGEETNTTDSECWSVDSWWKRRYMSVWLCTAHFIVSPLYVASEIMRRCTCNGSRYEVLMRRIHVWAPAASLRWERIRCQGVRGHVFFVVVVGITHVDLEQAFDNFVPLVYTFFISCFMHDFIHEDYWLCFVPHIVRYARFHFTFLYVKIIYIRYEHKVM